MQKIKTNFGYIMDIELSRGIPVLIDYSNNDIASFEEEDAKQIKEALEQYYKNKNIEVEIVIEEITKESE